MGLVELLDRVDQAMAGVDPAVLAGPDAAALAERVALTERVCAATRARLAARATAAGAHRERGFQDAGEWVARTSGISLGEARTMLATAETLGTTGAAAAFAAGELSMAQAREVARTAVEAPGSETAMVGVARSGSLRDLQDEGRRRRERAADPRQLHERRSRARRFRHWRDELGMVAFAGALPPEVGVPFVHRVEAATARIRREARRQGSIEPWEAHAADGLAEVVASRGDGAPRRPEAELVVVADLRAWRRGHAHPGEPVHILGGGAIPVDVAKELGRDAFLKAVIHDGVAVQTVAHFGRHIPAHVRTALELGAPPDFEGAACADDGCGHRRGLEWDHDVPYVRGGPTSLGNIKGRCWGGHQEKTRRDRQLGLLQPPDPEPGDGTTGRDPP